MQRSLRLLLVSDHGYFPDRTGGKEVSTHELATSYASEGHDVLVLTSSHIPNYRPNSITGAVRFAKSSLARRLADNRLAYRVQRSDDVQLTMRELIKNGRFDLTILQFDVPHKKLDLDLPPGTRYIVYIRDARDVADMRQDSFPARVALVANSVYTANCVSKQTGRNVATIIPYVDKARYLTQSSGPFTTFINPVVPKGVDLAFEIAGACPELPFLFVEGWPLSRRARCRLIRRIDSFPNITFQKRVADMRSVYRKTRVLLVPSQWEESWGRVVTESQFSGIPVLASRIGGLPESVGCGGVLIESSAPVASWAGALRELYQPDPHATFSTLARVQSDLYWAKAHSLPAALLACRPEQSARIRSGNSPADSAPTHRLTDEPAFNLRG